MITSLKAMSSRMKRIATYVRMSVLFILLGYAVLYLAGAPIVTFVTSHGKLIIVKGAPSYPNEYDPEMSKLVMNKKSTFDESEIQVPALETHYGNILCERIDLTAPIYYGDSDTALENGVGQYPASGLPGQGKPILIGGHDGTFFAPLEKIEPGDVVRVSTNYGQFEYKVTATKIADAMDATAYDLTQTKEQLILYTCYPFGQLIGDRKERYFVYCDKVDNKSAAE
jgi:sortase A